MALYKSRQYFFRIDARRPPISVGNKAFNLHRLIQKGILVPKTYAICWTAYDRYLQGHESLIAALRQQLKAVLDPARAYAIRSSANVEDSLEHSFAGQFKTVLGVQGEESILMAVRSIWDSAHSTGVQVYLNALTSQQRDLQMAVILQEMVNPVVSGVSFSRNPITGENEVIVEAVQGDGTALVQEGVTPLRWVSQSEGWKSCPEEPAIDTCLIKQVVQQTRQIASLFKVPVDLEWVYDGQDIYWVQMREITSLKNLTIYSNRIAKEVLPGMIKPLVWSINIPLVNSVWIQLFTELVGKNNLTFDDLSRSFYYRTYFNLSALGRMWDRLNMPRESLEMIMGILPRTQGQRIFKPSWRLMRLVPRLLVFLQNKWGLGDRFEKDYPRLAATVQDYDWQNVSNQTETDLLAKIDRLYTDLQHLVYYNINIPLLMAVYNTLFGRYLKNADIDPTQFDMMAGMPEYLEHAPDRFLKDLQQDYACLDPTIREQIRHSTYLEFLDLPDLLAFQNKVTDFLRRFGHLSDSGNDFSTIPWREQPELILKLISQEPAVSETTAAKVYFENLKLAGWKRWWANLLFKRARKFRLYREQISSLYTFAYGLFRPYFLVLGSHFSDRGVIFEPGDIYYLSRNEIHEIISATLPTAASALVLKPQQDYAALATTRKAEMIRCQDVKLPTLIYGEEAPLVDNTGKDKLTGVPTSGGYYSGPIKVVHGLQELHTVQPGDVLVIPFSDVGWTPLFARAGAVIAESGGILSHSSIMAREYQIPAVVSVPGAMSLQNNMLVSVDGYRGEVILHK